MQPIDAYLMYCAMKAHFDKGDYDFIKYGGKSKVSRDSFYKRNDRIFFVKLTRKYKDKQDIQDYLLSNFLRYPKGWVGKFHEDNYTEWKKKIQSLSYTFKSEIEPILDSKLIAVAENKHPKLLKEYLGKRISLESMVILDSILGFSQIWNMKLEDDYAWKDVYKLMSDYKSFLKFDSTKFKFVLRELMI
tara:strand:+ start:547 stop:1113 length:567 start_codon:yes stop_codon:yes gene_type:complete